MKATTIIKLMLCLVLLTYFSSCSGGSDDSNDDPIIILPPDDDDPIDDGDPVQPCSEVTLPPEVPMFDLETVFPIWSTSQYILPYNVGATFFVNQGNHTGFGHSGFWRYGYDFTMFIGTEILASRSGIVVHANDGTNDGNPNGTNLITIQHDDGTVALYSHLTRNGVLVNVGDNIEQGDLIGLSGNTGNTGGLPHLHFSLHPCSNLPGLPNPGNCPTQPVNFRNTESNPNGLGTWQCYTANKF